MVLEASRMMKQRKTNNLRVPKVRYSFISEIKRAIANVRRIRE